MQSIPVQTANASYRILVGVGAFKNLPEHLHDAGLSEPFLVVSQPRILKAVGQGLRKSFPIAFIPDGERAKSLTTVSRLLDRMIDMKLTRQSTAVSARFPYATLGRLVV